MKFDIKHILIFGLALGMTSCVETMKDGDMSTGFLGVPVLDADIQVEEFGATKAAPSLPELSVPDTSTLHFKVTDSKSNVVWNQKGLWRDPLQMPVGSYTIEVTYGSNTYGNPWYTGTCNGEISAVTEEVPAIGLRLCNSLLAVVLADDFTQHFTPSEGNCVTISSTSGSITTTLGNYVFVPSEETLTIQVAGTNSTVESKTLSRTLENPLKAATATCITCSLTTTDAPGAPKIKLEGTPEAWGTVGYIPVATTANISDANVAKMKYFASSNDWTDSVEGTVDGGTVKFTGLKPGATYKVRAQLGALKSNEVSMTMSTSALSIKTAADHTYTDSGELDGTDFTASFSVAEKFGVTASSLQLCKTDGTPLRTVDLNGTSTDWTSDGSALTGLNDWPFLPGGEYKLKGTATQNGSSVTLADLPISVPATPDFEVRVSGKTTYDYSRTNVDKANSLVAETIYEVGYSVSGISAALLKNSNYGLSCQYAINDTKVELTDGTITGCSWGINNLTATVTFAGKQKKPSSALPCHITGLPYNVNKLTISNFQNDWSSSGGTTEWRNGYLYYGNTTVTFKGFKIHNEIKASVSYKILTYVSTRVNDITTILNAGSTSVVNETIRGTAKETIFENTVDIKFDSSNNTITSTANCNNPTTWGSSHCQLHYISVIYK